MPRKYALSCGSRRTRLRGLWRLGSHSAPVGSVPQDRASPQITTPCEPQHHKIGQRGRQTFPSTSHGFEGNCDRLGPAPFSFPLALARHVSRGAFSPESIAAGRRSEKPQFGPSPYPYLIVYRCELVMKGSCLPRLFPWKSVGERPGRTRDTKHSFFAKKCARYQPRSPLPDLQQPIRRPPSQSDIYTQPSPFNGEERPVCEEGRDLAQFLQIRGPANRTRHSVRQSRHTTPVSKHWRILAVLAHTGKKLSLGLCLATKVAAISCTYVRYIAASYVSLPQAGILKPL